MHQRVHDRMEKLRDHHIETKGEDLICPLGQTNAEPMTLRIGEAISGRAMRQGAGGICRIGSHIENRVKPSQFSVVFDTGLVTSLCFL